jgi:hypothetical protein
MPVGLILPGILLVPGIGSGVQWLVEAVMAWMRWPTGGS